MLERFLLGSYGHGKIVPASALLSHRVYVIVLRDSSTDSIGPAVAGEGALHEAGEPLAECVLELHHTADAGREAVTARTDRGNKAPEIDKLTGSCGFTAQVMIAGNSKKGVVLKGKKQYVTEGRTGNR